MKKIKLVILQFVISVVILPFIFFLLFLLLGAGRSSWFFPSAVALGNSMLIVFSPNHSIIQGLKNTRIMHWGFASFAFIFFAVYFSHTSIVFRLISGICIFMSLIGYSSAGFMMRKNKKRG